MRKTKSSLLCRSIFLMLSMMSWECLVSLKTVAKDEKFSASRKDIKGKRWLFPSQPIAGNITFSLGRHVFGKTHYCPLFFCKIFRIERLPIRNQFRHVSSVANDASRRNPQLSALSPLIPLRMLLSPLLTRLSACLECKPPRAVRLRECSLGDIQTVLEIFVPVLWCNNWFLSNFWTSTSSQLPFPTSRWFKSKEDYRQLVGTLFRK